MPGALDRDELWRKAKVYTDIVCSYGKPVVHFGFIPVIIALGMTITEPQPSVAQLLSPI